MADQTGQPESDDAWDDSDGMSLDGSSIQDSLHSLRSSILDYRRENGRTYHRLSDGKYHLPNDKREQYRLDLAHNLWLLTWDGQLCNCPKKGGAKRVLDAGTGTGIWAMDFADDHPETIVIGVDLSAIQPSFVPSNCYFEIDDLEKSWMWNEPFDFIFARAMIAAFSNWPEFIAKAYDNLEPGGYLELHDNMFPIQCDDGTLPSDCAALRWNQLLIESTNMIGRPITVAPSFAKMLRDAGFEDVEERRERWPINPWPKDDQKLKQMGMWSLAATIQGVEATSLALFTRVLGWNPTDTMKFCASVRNEVMKEGIHAYYDVYAAWGRKPEMKA